MKENSSKAKNIIMVFRCVFAVWLCFGIYVETGPFTAFSFALVFITIEMIMAYIRKANQLAGAVTRKLGL